MKHGILNTDHKVGLKQPTFYRLVGFRNVWLFLGICLLGAWALEMLFWNGIFNSLSSFLIGSIWAFSIWVSQWLGNAYLVYILDARYPWSQTPVKRALIGIIALIIYSAAAYVLLQTAWHLIIQGHLPEQFGIWVLSTSRIAIIISFSIAFSFTTVGFFRNWQTSSLETERLRAEMMTYKYESLRSQINPHFLFNNLNVLKELIYDDPQLAEAFISRMSELYRYVLENSEKEAVALTDEIAFLRAYIFLLNARFEDGLNIQLEFEAESGEMIVPMALQLLIENAVKHNEVSSLKPLYVNITKQDDYLTVVNNLQPKQTGGTPSKKGLKNLSQRYEFLTERRIEVTKDLDTFKVHIPILKEAK